MWKTYGDDDDDDDDDGDDDDDDDDDDDGSWWWELIGLLAPDTVGSSNSWKLQLPHILQVLDGAFQRPLGTLR